MNMFFKKCAGAVVVVALFAVMSAEAFTLIVAPARYSVIQVAQDVLQRAPAVLVSYQGDAASSEPLLHAWNGREWVQMSMKDYREVSFLQRTPDQVVLIGGPDVLPQSLVDASSWASRVERVSDLTTGALVNEFGRVLNWRDSEWQWFAKRYNLTLTDEAAPRRHTSWYDQPGPLPDRPDLRPSSAKAPAVTSPVPVVDVPAAEPSPVFVNDVPGDDIP